MLHIFHGFALKMKFTFVNNQKRALKLSWCHSVNPSYQEK